MPSNALLENKSYVFFSHTHKGNAGNMPMLQSILDKVRKELIMDGNTDDMYTTFVCVCVCRTSD